MRILAGTLVLAALVVPSLPPARTASAATRASSAEPTDPPLIDLTAYRQLIAGYRGKAVMANFWATWCEPCRNQYPIIISLAKEYGPQGLAVVGVTLDEDADMNLVRRFLAQNHPAFPNFRGRPGTDASAFYHGVNPDWRGTMPQTDFYARDGHLARYFIGDRPRDAFVQAIRLILAVPLAENRNPSVRGN
jgi:thiol-disulfide isomerase/thioredoxin